jgi:predicted RNA binding protein YcfA (HicA-like mRNA interferase family)
MTSIKKAIRELKPLLEPLGFEYVGMVGASHQRWVHQPTGRVLITGLSRSDWRAIKNTVRTAKEVVRRANDNSPS